MFWKNAGGKIIVNANGQPINCPECPCGPPTGFVTLPCCDLTQIPTLLYTTVLDPTNCTGCNIDGFTVPLIVSGVPVTGDCTGYVWYPQKSFTFCGCIFDYDQFGFPPNWHLYIYCCESGSAAISLQAFGFEFCSLTSQGVSGGGTNLNIPWNCQIPFLLTDVAWVAGFGAGGCTVQVLVHA
jgi:hypothetical protein